MLDNVRGNVTHFSTSEDNVSLQHHPYPLRQEQICEHELAILVHRTLLLVGQPNCPAHNIVFAYFSFIATVICHIFSLCCCDIHSYIYCVCEKSAKKFNSTHIISTILLPHVQGLKILHRCPINYIVFATDKTLNPEP